MRLISLNIGIRIDNSKQVAEFIESESPDIVAFQEILRNLDNSVFQMYRSKEDIENIIGKRLPYHFFGPLYISQKFMFEGKLLRDFGGYIEQGNEVISRFPITTATNEFYYKTYSFDSDRTNFRTEDHARAVQIIEFDVNGKKLQILNVHGIHSKDKQDSERTIKQCKYVLEAAKRKNIPTIIVGDFNLFPATKSINLLSKEFRNLILEYNIKSTRPDFKDEHDEGGNVVDYIFVNDKIRVNNFEVIKTDISDHLPLILDFDIID